MKTSAAPPSVSLLYTTPHNIVFIPIQVYYLLSERFYVYGVMYSLILNQFKQFLGQFLHYIQRLQSRYLHPSCSCLAPTWILQCRRRQENPACKLHTSHVNELVMDLWFVGWFAIFCFWFFTDAFRVAFDRRNRKSRHQASAVDL